MKKLNVFGDNDNKNVDLPNLTMLPLVKNLTNESMSSLGNAIKEGRFIEYIESIENTALGYEALVLNESAMVDVNTVNSLTNLTEVKESLLKDYELFKSVSGNDDDVLCEWVERISLIKRCKDIIDNSDNLKSVNTCIVKIDSEFAIYPFIDGLELDEVVTNLENLCSKDISLVEKNVSYGDIGDISEEVLNALITTINENGVNKCIKEPKLALAASNIFNIVTGLSSSELNEIVKNDTEDFYRITEVQESFLLNEQNVESVRSIRELINTIREKGLNKEVIIVGAVHDVPVEYLDCNKHNIPSIISNVNLLNLINTKTGKLTAMPSWELLELVKSL